MVKDLIEAFLPLFKVSGGFAEILHLFLLLAGLALLVLEFRFKVKDFWSCICNPSIAMS
jgi:hypothetical protein